MISAVRANFRTSERHNRCQLLHAYSRAKNYILKLHNNRDVPNRLSNQLPEVRLYRRGLDRGRNYCESEVPSVWGFQGELPANSDLEKRPWRV